MQNAISINTEKTGRDARRMGSIDLLVSDIAGNNREIEDVMGTGRGEAVSSALDLSREFDLTIRTYQTNFRGVIAWLESTAKTFEKTDEDLAQVHQNIGA